MRRHGEDRQDERQGQSSASRQPRASTSQPESGRKIVLAKPAATVTTSSALARSRSNQA